MDVSGEAYLLTLSEYHYYARAIRKSTHPSSAIFEVLRVSYLGSEHRAEGRRPSSSCLRHRVRAQVSPRKSVPPVLRHRNRRVYAACCDSRIRLCLSQERQLVCTSNTTLPSVAQIGASFAIHSKVLARCQCSPVSPIFGNQLQVVHQFGRSKAHFYFMSEAPLNRFGDGCLS